MTRATLEGMGVAPREHEEGTITKAIEHYTSKVPLRRLPEPGPRLDRPGGDDEDGRTRQGCRVHRPMGADDLDPGPVQQARQAAGIGLSDEAKPVTLTRGPDESPARVRVRRAGSEASTSAIEDIPRAGLGMGRAHSDSPEGTRTKSERPLQAARTSAEAAASQPGAGDWGSRSWGRTRLQFLPGRVPGGSGGATTSARSCPSPEHGPCPLQRGQATAFRGGRRWGLAMQAYGIVYLYKQIY